MAELRAGGGPRFLHARTYRLEGHTATDKALYRSTEEVAARQERDPLTLLAGELRARDVGAAEIEGILIAAEQEMAAAFAAALAAPMPTPVGAAHRRPGSGSAAMARLSFAEATRQGLAEEMRRDPTVWALGEDLGLGGIFGQYKGLADEFGA